MPELSAHQTFALLAAVDPLLAAFDHLVAVRTQLDGVLPAVAPLPAPGDAVHAAALRTDAILG